MTHHTDPHTREAELDHDRESLASTLDELQDRMSVDHLAREALETVRENVGAYAHSIDSAIRANPLALALTGAGLAWLIFGGRKDDAHASGHDGRYGYTSTRSTASPMAAPPGHASRGYQGDRGGDDHGWAARIDDLRHRAAEMMSGLEEGASDYVAKRGRVLSDFTADMRDSLRHGLDDLSETARERVMNARQAAYAARLRVVRGVGQQVGGLVENHPMVAGTIAMAIGAAFAASLPRTQIEDRAFGAESDRLMDAASDMLREERTRMARVAEDVTDEVRSAAQDAANAVAEGVEELAEGAGTGDGAERKPTQQQAREQSKAP